MKSDINGCSTCKPGQELWEEFTGIGGVPRLKYDFRTPDGKLFSTVVTAGPDDETFDMLNKARNKRDAWQAKQI